MGWHRACICQLAVDCCSAGSPTRCPGGKWFLDKVSLGACRNKLDPDDRVDSSRAAHDDDRLLPDSLLGSEGECHENSSSFLWHFSGIKQSRLLVGYPGSTASRSLFRLCVLTAIHSATAFVQDYLDIESAPRQNQSGFEFLATASLACNLCTDDARRAVAFDVVLMTCP